MNRVLIVGCPGSGKSTFARKLSRATSLPLYYLDMLRWSPEGIMRPAAEFLVDLRAVLKREQWIIDGNYLSTMEERAACCDTIFFLDYPLEVCLEGIRSRKGKPRVDMPFIPLDEQDEEFMSFIRNYNKDRRPQVLELLQRHSDKRIIVFRDRREANEFLATIANRYSIGKGDNMSEHNVHEAEAIAKLIDHTILKADATKDDVRRICDEARRYGFASVCVNPAYVENVSCELDGTDIAVCSVIGFPLGATTPDAKAFEANEAMKAGADEIDMVINIGAVKSGDWDAVRRDIASVAEAVKGKAKLKVIIEACLLDDSEKMRVCEVAKEEGADFVKTSTGFSSGGATVHDVRLMRETVGPDMGVKASGGIHTAEEAVKMVEAGASRLGTSSGVQIMEGLAHMQIDEAEE